MDPPSGPLTSACAAQPLTNQSSLYTESIESSPGSRATDYDDQIRNQKLRLMCSYGGHIVPRLHDKSLCYVGGDTRMVVIDRASTLADLLNRLTKTLNLNQSHQPFSLKYQLPNEDLDSLITLSTDEDLDNMIDEYDRLSSPPISSKPSNAINKPARIRFFLFPSRPEGAQSMGPILDGSNRTEDWFLNALNGAAELHRGFSDPAFALGSLLGHDDDGDVDIANPNYGDNIRGGKKVGNQTAHDVHSVPDSPIIETTSSFGSTSSPPSIANLPPIRVHVRGGGGGIEERFSQIGVSVGGGGGGGGVQVQKQVDEGFAVISSPPSAAMVTTFATAVAGEGGGGGGEFGNLVHSDDERSDHGVPMGYRKQQQQIVGQQSGMPSQPQQMQQFSGELPSPDSVSSDSSLSSAIGRQKPAMYQDPNGQSSLGNNRLPQGMQMQQVTESGYIFHPQYEHPQYEQHQQQMLQHHQYQQQQQQQHHQQQQQHLLQQQQQQQQEHGQTQSQNQQQYIPSSGHYVQQHPPGSVPVQSYYPMYQPQQPQHHPHQYPVYYMQAGQGQGYSLPSQQQPNMGKALVSDSSNRTQNPPDPRILTTSPAYNPTRNMNMAPPKPELGPGVYRTATPAGGPKLVQVPPSQHQMSAQSQPQHQQLYMGYPSQSITPHSGYGYEFSDPALSRIYYNQPMAPGLASQYQGASSVGPTMMMSDVSSQHSNDNA